MSGYDLIIPVYNEKKILELIEYLLKNTKKIKKIFICYDNDNDITLKLIEKSQYIHLDQIILVKNNFKGPCEAVKTGIEASKEKAVIVYPADDFHNGLLLDEMYKFFELGYDVVCPSRFIEGGFIKNCPLIKYILVKLVSFSLFYLSKINIKDPTNGFRLFSKKLIEMHPIESKVGFAYSLELLINAKMNNFKIIELPSIWIERNDRKSTFKILRWSTEYLKWFFKAISS